MKSINSGGIIQGLAAGIDDILSLRDSLGVALMPVYHVVRSWSGGRVGKGDAYEVETQILPSPKIVSMSNDYRIKEGGAVQIDDIQIRGVSKVKYPAKADIDCSLSDNEEGVERFYALDGELYKVVYVEEKHLTWNLHLRKLSNQKRYPPPPAPEIPPEEDGEDEP